MPGLQRYRHPHRYRKVLSDMAADKKARAKAEQAKGKAKKTAGRTMGNERLTAEGRADQVKGDAREAKEKAKDVFDD